MQKRKSMIRILCGLVVALLMLPLSGIAEEGISSRWEDAADEIDKYLDAAFESYLDGDPDAAYSNVSISICFR